MTEASCDYETRSDIDIKTCGAYRYAESPHFMPLMLAWSIGGGVVQLWTHRDRSCPPELRAHIEAGGPIRAFNANFERLVFNWLAANRGWPKPALEQYRCTAAEAAAMALPRRLDKLGEALDINAKKDRRGAALIKLFSIPRCWTGLGKPLTPLWNDENSHPAEWREFVDYCKRDVEAEREIASRLVPLSEYEWKVYALNERINDRGLRIDVKSARAAVTLAERATREMDREMAIATGGAVAAATQVARLKTWIASRGVDVSTLGKDDIDDLLHRDDLPAEVRTALEIRAEAAKPSVTKIAGMLRSACADGRIYGSYLHHGAGQTGRFSSRGAVQVHNLSRYRKIFEDAHLDFNLLYEIIRFGDPALLKLMYGEELGRPLHMLSDAIRGFIWAAPGHEFVVADYSSIEGRLAAWATGETWKVEAYRALDQGEGHGIYELAAAGIYGIPVEAVTKQHRQVGKISELSLGYAGGVGAIARFARPNQIKLGTLFEALWAAATPETRTKAEKRLAERVEKHDRTAALLGREGWLAAELIKLGWREKHPRIRAAWSALETAAVEAVESPGGTAAVGCSFLVKHDFLWMRLPSGRCVAYGRPRMMEVEAPWADPTVEPAKRERKRSLTARGAEAGSDNYVRFPLYGGQLFNALIQGLARDILVHGMFAAEAAGFPIHLTTHDEIGAEVPTGSRGPRELEEILCRLPPWADGLPMTAAGFAGKRYRKG